MNIIRHEDVEKDLKKLRRFAAPLESLEAWERLFCCKIIVFSRHGIYNSEQELINIVKNRIS